MVLALEAGVEFALVPVKPKPTRSNNKKTKTTMSAATGIDTLYGLDSVVDELVLTEPPLLVPTFPHPNKKYGHI
ncbi:hypothetical protein PF005_g17166 [Phytophthora fragariae]|uniref:Uncharacterized protein n=1 Tax=Phytophthora fragariae TaxID=53985 RepID=A0A6A3RGM0_9STRA|nr:hypothetical protein PF003_g35412 [Phytophthora fragariae]KAE8931221.1 hypothetical protein PF009_g18715 [Phytophthora fragariae]KAE9096851.1 hypothetical protein PF007_g16832 [Phytophthora fragariae]KAE9100397.1 hypothetical protein PF010_g14832 [Phytophthora fragariae]KAE9195738.1 hypothetical protein PF005_g17166 [Phytophthora fragariae]